MPTRRARKGPGQPLGRVLLALTLLGAAGCSQTGSVSGVVRYKGQPLPSGTVTFMSGTTVVRTATIGAGGTYSVDKVPVGEARVSVTTPQPPAVPAAARMMDASKMGAPDAQPGGNQSQVKPVTVPQKYQNPDTSGLTYTVTPGTQSKDFDLN